ncbi:rhoptry protein [Cystoisospora suis]|uniref:Rhoptry protein n=1 Tax=Cystoisospora suis TaxID=483139 RepID=A0A2C6LFI3_9APIC|nr:rhoptry protein [Cystoisospora suis]
MAPSLVAWLRRQHVFSAYSRVLCVLVVLHLYELATGKSADTPSTGLSLPSESEQDGSSYSGSFKRPPVATFKFDALRAVYEASRGMDETETVKRALVSGKRAFDSIVEELLLSDRRPAAGRSEHDRKSRAQLSSSPSFEIETIPTFSLGGIEELRFFCSLSRLEGSPDSAVRCVLSQPRALPGSLKVGFIFQLPPERSSDVDSKASTKQGEPFQSLCRIIHQTERAETPLYLEGAIGVCVAFGFDSQLVVHGGNPLLDLVPELHPKGLTSIGFQPVPARYIKPFDSLSFVGIKPTKPHPGENDRSEADFLPSRELDSLSWRGVAIDSGFYDRAISTLKRAIESARVSEGSTDVRDCTIYVGLGYYSSHIEAVAGQACRPGSTLLGCISAVRTSPRFDAKAGSFLDYVSKEVEQLAPSVTPRGSHMKTMLLEKPTWKVLYQLIGPRVARLFETSDQTRWYEEEMLHVKQHTADKDISLEPSSDSIESEVIRFPIWYLDLYPSKAYWESLSLGCIKKELAYLREMGRVFVRRSAKHLAVPTSLDGARQGDAGQHPVLLQKSVGGASSHESEIDSQTKDELIAQGTVILSNGRTVQPLQDSYAFEDLKAVSNLNPARAESDAGLRRLWLASPLFEERGEFTVTGVPARDGGSFDLKFICTKYGHFRVSTNLVGWFSNYICEPRYVNIPNSEYTGTLRSGNMPVNRLIGIEFEDKDPWRCGVSFLGTERHIRETAVRGRDLLKIMTGICSLLGFKEGWILDSVTDMFTKERMKITMVLEKRISFYENQGFLLSINTFKRRDHLETCVGSSAADPTALLSGICKQPGDILINPGFEANAFYTLAERAYDTLYNLTFDCRSPSWQNCETAFPLSRKDGRGEGCAFERSPLFHDLRFLNPQKCDVGKRIGDCHAYVRQHLKCNRKEKKGCKYLKFLHTQFLYPGGDPESKLPRVIQDHYEMVGKELHQERGSVVYEAIKKGAAHAIAQLRSGITHAMREGEAEENGTANEEPAKEIEKIEAVRDMLLESLIFVDWTGTPQFWIRSLYDYDPRTGRRKQEDENNLFCPVAYAWAYITRLSGQLYRHSADYFQDMSVGTKPKVLESSETPPDGQGRTGPSVEGARQVGDVAAHQFS